jgi:hypothetical protein
MGEQVDAPPVAEVEFGEATVAFRRYPYPPSSVFPDGVVSAEDIVELVENFRPPALRTTEGDFLVLPESALPEARAFAARNNVPVVRRVDVWALILEPFMDARTDRQTRAAMAEALRRSGLSAGRVLYLRWRTSLRVEFLHCLHWSWQHYGLADVLDALRTVRMSRRLERFYAEAMQIAALGEQLDEGEPDPAAPLRTGPRLIDAILTRP